MIKKILGSFLAVICAALAAGAQTGRLPAPDAARLVGSRLNATMLADQAGRRLREVFGDAFPAPAGNIDLFKISYRSRTPKGAPVVLSGLVALPKDAPKGLVIYNHGTTTDLARSPSRYAGKFDATEAALAALAFAAGGYAVAMPDYLGLGDDRTTFHPYPLGALNSVAAIDLIEPARALAARKRVEVGPNLFVTGYSEGGGVAMWTLRELERKNGPFYRATAGAPLSGPYDLSGTTRRWLLAGGTDQEAFVVRLYLLSYMAQSFHKNDGLKLTDYFRPSMAFAVAQAYKTHRTDEAVIKRLALAAVLMRAKNSLESVVTPRFWRALQTTDVRDPVIRELKRNDAYDWRPRTPLLLVNLAGDEVVDEGNTETAFRELRERGAGDLVRREVIRDAGLNHITAVAAALKQARIFFDGQR